MIKKFCITVFTLFTILSYGQNIVFQPNVNHKARYLKQGLNRSGDSLILESSNNLISQVDIFNKFYLKSVDVDSSKTKINLNMLPAGNFIVQARVGNKRIIMYLQKRDSSIVAYSEREKSDQQNIIKPKLKSKRTKEAQKHVTYYWVVEESNSNFGSSKSMKLIYKDEVHDLIEKNKLEIQSKIGKDNTLVVYAIYNKDKFMRKQYRNPKYYRTARNSKHFEIVPFYSTFNEVEILPNS